MIQNQELHSCNTEKCCQVRKWVSAFLKTPAEVLVGEVSYTTPEGASRLKTVICIPDLLPEHGIFCIDKPVDSVTPTDIIPLCKALNGGC
jgi:hypothetical protein